MNSSDNIPKPLKEAFAKIKPPEYEGFLKQINLEAVYLSNIDFERALDAHHKDIQKANLEFFEDKASFDNCETLKKTYGSIRYRLQVKYEDSVLLAALVTFTAEFSYEEKAFDENTFAIFLHLSLKMMMQPYIRACASHIISESFMGFFTLPMLKMMPELEQKEK